MRCNEMNTWIEVEGNVGSKSCDAGKQYVYGLFS